MNSSARSILIVGGTSLIAQYTARQWVSQGATRIRLIGRNAPSLDRVAADLRVRGSRHALEVETRAIDLTDPVAIAAELRAAAIDLKPDTVLIAHGAMYDPAMMRDDLVLAHDQLEVTGVSPVLWLEGAVSLTGAQRIGVIGSVAGDRGRASNYLYGASKGMVERAAEGMSHRLHGSGRTVTLIKPGPTATPMTAELQAAGARLASAETIARDIARAVTKGAQTIYAPGLWRWIMLIVKLVPKQIFNRTSL